MSKQKIMNEAIRLAMRINGGTEVRSGYGHPTAFIYYSGHINVLEVEIYENGWVADAYADISYYFSLDKDEDKLMQVLENLKEYAEKLAEKKKGK